MSAGHPSTREAEHAWRGRAGGGPAPRWVATVFTAAGVEVVDAQSVHDLPEGARLFVFPGHDQVADVVTVADLLARTGVDDVVALGGLLPDPGHALDPQDFVRPVVEGGRVVLRVRPAAAGLVPFEQPHPTPCCADHG